MNKIEFFRYSLECVFIIFVISWLFFGNLKGSIIISPLSIGYLKSKKNKRIRERKEELKRGFKDGILGLSSALNAGYSIENAFRRAISDLSNIYGQQSCIVKEFEAICRQLEIHKTIEEALLNLGQRSGIEDIGDFAEIFAVAKRTGGNLIQVIRMTGKNMNDKQEVNREIQTMISGKKLEAKVMLAVPPCMIFYLKLSSPGFLDSFYESIGGILVMGGLLLTYIITVFLVGKITNIEV